MALTSSITGRNFGGIGQVGESAGFSDFTAAQIATNGFAQVAQRSTELISDTVFAGVTTDTAGKTALVAAIKVQADIYIATVFDTVGKTVDAKILINNIVFADKADATVVDTASKYVERDPITTAYWTLKVQVS